MRFLVIVFFILLFCFIFWKVIGKDLAAFIADDFENEMEDMNDKPQKMVEEKSLRQIELEDKIKELKEKAEELKLSTDEIKVTKMLEEVMKQLKEREDELEKLDTNIWLNK